MAELKFGSVTETIAAPRRGRMNVHGPEDRE